MEHIVSMSQNSKTVTAQKGDTIHLELEENPTTGYAWDISMVDSNILQLQSSDYKLSGGGGIGSGGMRDMIFIVQNSGSGRLKLENKQRWSGDVYQHFEINVNAQ